MGFQPQEVIDKLDANLVKDPKRLGKIYRSKKDPFHHISVAHNQVDDYLKEGWEDYGKVLKTKTKLRKPKSHSEKFEDDIWCQLYKLGYRILNSDRNFKLPFGKNQGEVKQVDVIAIDDDSILIFECKSSEKSKKPKSFKDEFTALSLILDGYRKTLSQLYGATRKIKYVFATRNLRVSSDSMDIKRLLECGGFYYNDNTYSYINSLIKNYKDAAKYQLLGILFKNEIITKESIDVPAIEGFMGNEKYYMFSIEPSLLLKMGFVLHRTKANESEMPTYQRLLVPSRLKGITKFIDKGGYFPNSIIVNFTTSKKNKVIFQGKSRNEHSRSRAGILKIPNAYSFAYIIDGQHRLYGYASSVFKNNNTVPVVAFLDLDATKQLEIFMDINQNQKAVSPSLRLTLEEDLYWNSEIAASRLKALKSAIVKDLGSNLTSPLLNKITIGEDSSHLAFKPFYSALTKCGLLPKAIGNKLNEDSIAYALYDITQNDHNKAMLSAKKKIVTLISDCYEIVEDSFPDLIDSEKAIIYSNRGTYAFLMIIGSLNKFLIDEKIISRKSSTDSRVDKIKPFLLSLLKHLSNISDQDYDKYLNNLGAGADTKWFRYFQSVVNQYHSDYEPLELIDWKERKDENLQIQASELIVEIEKYIKKHVLKTVKDVFEENWDLEINAIKRECLKRAEEENERFYKEGLKRNKTEWTEMFTINDYKSIITKYWTKKPDGKEEYVSFQDRFTIDIGEGIGSKSARTKWLSYFNTYRNLSAHAGSKDKGLNKEEVEFLKTIKHKLIESS